MEEMEQEGTKLLEIVTTFMKLAIILVILGGCAWFLFQTKTVVVTGVSYTDPLDTKAWLMKQKWSESTLCLLGKYNLGHPTLLPFMEDMEISLKNPWTVEVHVKEKKPIGTVKDKHGYVAFDKEGLALYRRDELPEHLPLIEGMEFSKKLPLYQTIPAKSSSVFRHVEELLAELQQAHLKADTIDSDGKNLFLTFGKIKVQMGNDNLKEKVLQLPGVLERLDGKEGVLKMEHYNEDSKYISFQMTTPPTENKEENGNPKKVDQEGNEQNQ